MGLPTAEDFRTCGWTADAINYPITEEAFQYRCRFNGISSSQAPKAWRFAPNEWVQNDLNTKGREIYGSSNSRGTEDTRQDFN